MTMTDLEYMNQVSIPNTFNIHTPHMFADVLLVFSVIMWDVFIPTDISHLSPPRGNNMPKTGG